MKRTRKNSGGFTLVELLLSAFLGFVVTVSIYLVFIGTTRQYSVQEQIVAMQESMRFAVDFIKTELKSAGRLAVVNGRRTDALDSLGARDPMLCPTREDIQAFELFENDDRTPAILSSAPNHLKPDRLRLLKDAPGSTPLRIQRIQGRVIELDAPSEQVTPSGRALSASAKRMGQVFIAGHYLFLLSRTGLVDLIPIVDFRFGANGSSVELLEQPCDVGGKSLVSQCAFGACVAVPVELVEYRVELEPDSDRSTRLSRYTIDARDPTQDLGSRGLVLASDVVDFQVMGIADLRTQAQLALGSLNQNLIPLISEDQDPRDDRGNSGGDTESESLNPRPESIRSLRVVLAVRTKREDAQYRVALDRLTAPGSRQPTERTWFEVDDLSDTGYARVTTLSFEVETPNLYRGN